MATKAAAATGTRAVAAEETTAAAMEHTREGPVEELAVSTSRETATSMSTSASASASGSALRTVKTRGTLSSYDAEKTTTASMGHLAFVMPQQAPGRQVSILSPTNSGTSYGPKIGRAHV